MAQPRNFWLSAEVDGRQTNVETGPSGEDGGFTLRITMRDNDADGGVLNALVVRGNAYRYGELSLTVTPTTDREKITFDLDNSGALTIETRR